MARELIVQGGIPLRGSVGIKVQKLLRMNADIQTEGNRAVIQGERSLSGAPVIASDLRAAAALLLAGLAAKLKIHHPECLEQAEA